MAAIFRDEGPVLAPRRLIHVRLLSRGGVASGTFSPCDVNTRLNFNPPNWEAPGQLFAAVLRLIPPDSY